MLLSTLFYTEPSKLGLLVIFSIVLFFSFRFLALTFFEIIKIIVELLLFYLISKWVVYATTTPPSGSSGGSNSNPSGGNSPNGAGNTPGNGGNLGDPLVVVAAAVAMDLFQVEFHSIVVEPIDEAKRNLLSDFNAEATTKTSGSVIKKTP